MKKRKILLSILFVLFVQLIGFVSSCSVNSTQETKTSYYSVPETCEVTLYQTKNWEKCFNYELSKDKEYYCITGISDYGKALFDFNETILYSQNLADHILSSGWSQSSSMGFEVTIPSMYQDLPVKELGPNSLSYLAYYSCHITIPTSITIIDTNAIVLADVSAEATRYRHMDFTLSEKLQNSAINDSDRGYRDIFIPASFTWNIGEEELRIAPYAFRLSLFYTNYYLGDSRYSLEEDDDTPLFHRPVYIDLVVADDNPYYVLEDSILYNKEKTKVIFGYDFSSWLDEENNIVIPDTIEEIQDGSFLLSSFTTSCNSIKIGKNLIDCSTYFFDYPTYGMQTIASIEVDPDNENFIFENGAIYNNEKTKLYYGFFENGNEVKLPSTLKEVGSMIFCKEGKVNLDSLPITILPSLSCEQKKENVNYSSCLERTTKVDFDEENLIIHHLDFKTSVLKWTQNATSLNLDATECTKVKLILSSMDLIEEKKVFRTYFADARQNYTQEVIK